ncbi:MAG: hypothetical protein NVS1B1_10860 [Candidatus Limnocylindrales bacterium]
MQDRPVAPQKLSRKWPALFALAVVLLITQPFPRLVQAPFDGKTVGLALFVSHPATRVFAFNTAYDYVDPGCTTIQCFRAGKLVPEKVVAVPGSFEGIAPCASLEPDCR